MVARFYGWTLGEVRDMSVDDFHSAEILIPRFEARDQLIAISCATYPHSKKNWQDKHHRALRDQCMADVVDRPSGAPVLSTSDLASIMAGRS
jgi:hypothetical protein